MELLHIEVRNVDVKETVAYTQPSDPESPVKQSKSINKSRVECLTCRNLITESNKSLICTNCGTQFCITCEEWFRGERKRGEGPFCKNCYIAERNRLREVAERKVQMEHEQEERLRKEKEEQEKLAKQYNSIGMKFTHIPAGVFMMGSKEFQEIDEEKPVHQVKIDKPFYLGTYPVTQREWKAIMGNNPSDFEGDDLPVEQVSWDDVQEFIKQFNENEGTDKYRLPSEAEWEYAARAGTTTRYCFGNDESKLDDYAWYDENSDRKTHPVGKKKSNDWGLYDMHGNVWECVQDEWHDDYEDAPTYGSAWENGDGILRVSRGGSWIYGAFFCRSAYRYPNDDPGVRSSELGFRLLKEL